MKTLKIAVIATILTILASAAWARPTVLWLESVSHDCTFAPDDTIRMNIRLDSLNDPTGIIGMAVQYYSSDFDLIRVERGSLIANWSSFQFNVSQGPALPQINIDASNATPLPVGTSGYLATLVFVFKSCGPNLSQYHFTVCWVQLWGDFDESVANVDERCGAIDVFPRSLTTGRLTVESLYHTCNDAAADTVEADIHVDQSAMAIDAAGFDVPYLATGALEYVGFKRGDLTAAWPFFDVSVLPGKLRVGGFTTAAIPSGSTGVFVTLRFVMHCCESTTVTSLCPQFLVDDFFGMTTACGDLRCTPLATRAVNWGYVKSLYR